MMKDPFGYRAEQARRKASEVKPAWGVFTWNAQAQYPADKAHRIFKTQSAAAAFAAKHIDLNYVDRPITGQ